MVVTNDDENRFWSYGSLDDKKSQRAVFLFLNASILLLDEARLPVIADTNLVPTFISPPTVVTIVAL